MNILLDIDKIEQKYIFFQDPIKNTVINNSNFIRILYSSSDFTLTNLHIKFNLKKNPDILQKIINLEKNILNLFNDDYNHYLKLKEQLNANNNKDIVLKISGIWENENSIGITSKLIPIT
jgi:hypothetical protein|tara:strand:+ start:1950 stop:2309 length:360 start_codon:yes stop_codon:yes gene_type:complete